MACPPMTQLNASAAGVPVGVRPTNGTIARRAAPAAMAEARAATSARSQAAGYADVLDKPFLVVEFLATLRHAVDAPTDTRRDGGNGISADAVSVFPELGGPVSSDFFAMAVHELRTPLTSISGHVQLAQRFLATDQRQAAAALEAVREQSRRLERLIGDILQSARMSVGALRLDVVTFDLGVVVAHTIGLLNTEDPPRISFLNPARVRVQGDPDRIAQILSNLLDNARKYSPEGAPVGVTLAVVGDQAQVRVADRGLGVPEDEQDRLFAPFYRTSRTRDLPGTGLGLHISRRIAEQHQGRLWLESTSDAGSVFALALPVALDERPTA